MLPTRSEFKAADSTLALKALLVQPPKKILAVRTERWLLEKARDELVRSAKNLASPR